MTLLTRDQILNAEDLKTEDIEVPEWGGTVRISVMAGRARDRYEAMLYESRDNNQFDNLRSKFLSQSIVNEDGNLMFTAGDIEALGKKSSSALDRVFQAASKLNGTSEDEMEEIAKN